MPRGELQRCFLRCGSRGREASRFEPCAGRTLGKPGLGKVLRRQLRLFRRRLGVVPLDRFGDPGMELLAAAFQQAVMGGIPYQRMLEDLACLRWAPAPKNQAGGFEPRERVSELCVRQTFHRGQQLVIELPTDRGADLRDLARRGEPIQPGQQ